MGTFCQLWWVYLWSDAASSQINQINTNMKDSAAHPRTPPSSLSSSSSSTALSTPPGSRGNDERKMEIRLEISPNMFGSQMWKGRRRLFYQPPTPHASIVWVMEERKTSGLRMCTLTLSPETLETCGDTIRANIIQLWLLESSTLKMTITPFKRVAQSLTMINVSQTGAEKIFKFETVGWTDNLFKWLGKQCRSASLHFLWSLSHQISASVLVQTRSSVLQAAAH